MSKIVRQHLFEQFQRLDEKLLTSEFTFGFELEAICNDQDLCHHLSDIREYIDRCLEGGAPADQKKKLISVSSIHQDSSVHGDGDEGDYDEDEENPEYSGDELSFEYASKVFPCTPYWFHRVISTLRDLMNEGFYTNTSCGFHHHLHFNGMTERDMVWMYCNLAMDSEVYDKFSKLSGVDNSYRLYSSDWASQDAMYDIKSAIESEDWKEVIAKLNTGKWRAFRIHPQGTLEWRGPRNFMNSHQLDNINRFYNLFNKLIDKLKTYMDLKKLTGTQISKEQFFQNLTDAVKNMTNKPDMEFISHTEGYDRAKPLKFVSDKAGVVNYETIKKLRNRFKSNPMLFVKVINSDPDALKFFISYISKKGELYSLMSDIQDKYLNNNSVDYEEKKEFVHNLIDTLKGVVSESTVSDIIKSFELDVYDIQLAIQALHTVGTIAAFKNLLRTIIRNSPQSLSMKDLEKSVYNLLSHGIFLSSVLKVLLQRQYVNILGEDYILRIIMWALRACVSTRKKIEGTNGGLESVVDKVKSLVTYEKQEKEWDLIISDLISIGSEEMFAYLIKKPSQEHIAKWIARNPRLRGELSDEEREQYSF